MIDQLALPAELAAPATKKKEERAPLQITLNGRTLAYLVAAVLTALTGGQLAAGKLTPDSGPELSAQIAQLSHEVSDLRAQQASRDSKDAQLMRAILVYVIESDRAWREAKGGVPARSLELERAANRVTELAAQ